MRHHSSKESCGSQNSSQSLNDLDKMDNNGSVQTAFFVPDGDYASANQKSPVPKRYLSEYSRARLICVGCAVFSIES